MSAGVPTGGSASPGPTRARRHVPTSGTAKELVALGWFFLGGLGVHRMILGSVAVGLLYALATVCTCGLGGIFGWIDGLWLVLGTPRDQHGLPVVWSWRRGKLTLDPLEEGTYDRTEALARIALHGGLVFVLPYLVVSASLTLFETSEVKDTLPAFAVLSTVVLGPLFLLQLVGVVRKALSLIHI